jgi:hypothetical protein
MLIHQNKPSVTWCSDLEEFERQLLVQAPIPHAVHRPADMQLTLPQLRFRTGWLCSGKLFQQLGERLMPGLGKMLLHACRGAPTGKGKKLPRPDLAVAWYNLAANQLFDRVRNGCLLITRHENLAVRWLPSYSRFRGWLWDQEYARIEQLKATEFCCGSLCGDVARCYLMEPGRYQGWYVRLASDGTRVYPCRMTFGKETGEVGYRMLPKWLTPEELAAAEESCRNRSLGFAGNRLISAEIRKELLGKLRLGGLTAAFAKRVLSRVICRGSAETCEDVDRKPQAGMTRSVADLCTALSYEAGLCKDPALRENAELLAGTILEKGLRYGE